MIRLIIAIAVLGLAMWLGPILVNHPGYVMIVVGGITIEATLIKMLFLLSLLALAWWSVWWLVKRLFHLPKISFSFLRSRKERRARLALKQGMMAFARQDFATASQQFDIAYADSEWWDIKQTMAAYSALLSGDLMKANQRAAQLDADEPDSWYVVADLLLRQQNPQAALAYLEPKMQQAHKAAGKDGKLGRLYIEALQQTGQWQRLLEQVPVAIKQQWFSKAQWQQVRFKLYPFAVQGLMAQSLFDENAAYWTALSAKERKSAAVSIGRAWGTAHLGQPDLAESQLVDVLALTDLKHAWPALRCIPLGRHVLALRKQLQHWLRDHPNNGYIYAMLAYCAVQEQDVAQADVAWHKALQYQPELAQQALAELA